MNDLTKHDPDVAANLEYLRAEEELRQHENEPLDAELRVNVQPFTLERLNRFMSRKGISLDYAVNDILKDWLYCEGE